MKSDYIIWARILLIIILVILSGMLISKNYLPELFERLTWVFVAMSSILIGLLIRVTWKTLKHPDDIGDEE